MIRRLIHGYRNYVQSPDLLPSRLNWEFFAVLKGQCAPHFIDGPPRPLRNSTLWLLPPSSEYVWMGSNRPCLRIVMHVPDVPEVIRERLGDSQCLETSITPTQGRRLLQLVRDIEPFYDHPNETYELRASHLIAEFCLTILQKEPAGSTSPLPLASLQKVQKAEAYYRKNLARRPTVTEIANIVSLSPSQLRRIFLKIRYATPQSIFVAIRLHEACHLLVTSEQTIDLIALQCGFSSCVDFHRTFRKQFQTTPHYWRTHVNPKGIALYSPLTHASNDRLPRPPKFWKKTGSE